VLHVLFPHPCTQKRDYILKKWIMFAIDHSVVASPLSPLVSSSLREPAVVFGPDQANSVCNLTRCVDSAPPATSKLRTKITCIRTKPDDDSSGIL
jgi:hypothetical protein